MLNRRLILISAFIFYAVCVSATDRVSVTSGNWGTAGTWSPPGIPVAGDNITISATHVITMNGNAGNCLSLTVNGTADWTQNRTTNVGAGGLIINNGGALNDATSTGSLNVAGPFQVPSGASVSMARLTIQVSGMTTISGTLNFSNAGGTKTFTDVTIASGGTWTSTVAENFTINGSFTNNGSFLSNTGIYTLAGASKVFSGTSNSIFSVLSVDGSYTNMGSLQVNTNLNGAGSLIQGDNSTLIIGDLTPGNIVTATATGNTVRYLVSGSMNTLDINYYNLLIDEIGGTVNGLGTYTVSGNYDLINGSASLSNVTVLGTVSVAAGCTLSIGNASPIISGSTNLSGTLLISSVNGIKTFGDISVLAGGTWNSTVAENFTINGSLSNSGTFTANTGTYILAGTSKTISGTFTVPTLSVTGTYTNNGTLSSTTSLTGGGTFSQGASGTLNMSAATFNVTTFNASAAGNTVNYNLAGIQNVRLPSDGSYHHLTLSGTGNKTLLGATDINGNLTISSALVANNFNITLAGNWTSTGTAFTPGTNTTTLDGTTQTIGRTGGETFNHLVVSGSGIKTLGSNIVANGNLTINSSLDVSSSNFGIDVKGNWANNGTFTQGNGTVTFSGASAQAVGGTVATNFYNITQNNATGVSLSQHQTLLNTLTISAGTFTTTGFNFTLNSDASGTARIATIPSGANFAGNLIMERYSGTGPTDWRFLTSCVSGATLAQWADDFATSGFTGSTDPGNSFVSIYTYDETQLGDLDTFGFVPATNTSDPIVPGLGYWVYLGPCPVTFEVVGAPYTFSQSPTVTFSNSGNIIDDGWNLIANPYPSAIDWDAAAWTKTNLDNAIYIYNSSTGSFASYVSGIGVNGGSRYIPSSQAFWVKANAASPSITAVEAVKAAPDPVFLKQARTPNTSSIPMAFKDFPIPQNTNILPESIKLIAKGNGFEDETLIYFKQGASSGFDGAFDAHKMPHLNVACPSIASVINDSLDLSINGYADLKSDFSIPIRFLVNTSGTYSLRRDSVLMLPMSSCVILEDLANGNLIDLRANISYSFVISDTTKAPRFLLHVYAPITKGSVNSTCANDSSGMAIALGTGTGPWNYVWKNAAGTVLKTVNNSNKADTLFNAPVGYYQVEISGSACGTVKDTITVKTTSSFAFTVNVSNVTCNGLSNGSANANVTGGASPFTYYWNTGATVSAVNNLPVGNYSVQISDGAGCSQLQSFSISEPSVLKAGFVISVDTLDLSSMNNISLTDTSIGATSFNWDFGDGSPVDTARNPLHYYSQSGIYMIELIASNGSCFDTVKKAILVVDSINTTGIAHTDHSQNVNVVYENGAVFLVFDLRSGTDVKITVLNALGENILVQNEDQIRKEKVRLPLNGFASGLYFAHIETRDISLIKKIILTLP